MNENSRSVSTPGQKEKEEEGYEEELEAENATVYRALVARANYLAQDRTDIWYTVKELCRRMSAPRACDWKRLKRLSKYLIGGDRSAIQMRRQRGYSEVNVWVDTDDVGCRDTRKSTSGWGHFSRGAFDKGME